MERTDRRSRFKFWEAVLVAFIVATALVNITKTDTQAQTSATTNCPSQAMSVAISLSNHVNQLNLPDLSNSSTNQQIASEINVLDPIFNSTLHISVPPLNGSSLRGLSVLVTPFDDFVGASRAVNQDNPESACSFLAAAVTLAADVTVLVVGNVTVTVFIAMLNVLGQYCDSGCVTTASIKIGNFIAANGSAAAKAAWDTAWNFWEGTHCLFLGHCVLLTTSSSPSYYSTTDNGWHVPEFNFDPVFAIVFTMLLIVAYLLVRRDGRMRQVLN